MKRARYALVWSFFISLISLAALVTPTATAQQADILYGKAVLLPMFGLSSKNGIGPQGTALFYKVGDAADSTRVVVEIDGLAQTEGIRPILVRGSCQGGYIATLNPIAMDQSGNAQSTTILTGQQVQFGEWYIRADFCDMLNPDSICAVCGKVEPFAVQTTGNGSSASGTTGNLPTTGASENAFPATFLLIATAMIGLTCGIYLSRARKPIEPHD